MTHNVKKQRVAEKIWLHYFNQELYKRGIINELERNKMTFKIENMPYKETEDTTVGYR